MCGYDPKILVHMVHVCNYAAQNLLECMFVGVNLQLRILSITM